MIQAENVSDFTGADVVDSYILLCMQESPLVFDMMAGGAGVHGKCLACIVPDKKNAEQEGGYDVDEAESE